MGVKRRHPVRMALMLTLLAYVLAAVIPYAFPPGSPEAAPAFSADLLTPAQGERATLLATGEEAMKARLDLIARAERSLVVGSYLFADDESGLDIASALLSAADRGVEVRILVDGLVGGLNLLGGDLGYVLGAHESVELRFYQPVNLLSPWSLNARYHEKYVIMDDRAFVLGGRNISDEFLTPQQTPGANDDLDILVWCESADGCGAVEDLLAYVNTLWEERCVAQYQSVPSWKRRSVEELTQALAQRYETLRPASLVDWASRTAPLDAYGIVVNPTLPSVKEPTAWNALISLMAEAQERVWVLTPYLVLDGRMRDDLSAVAGLPSDMRVITNSRASGNNIVASADMLLHKGMITGMDLTLYETQRETSLHTKALLIDDDLAAFGSFNFDMRSAYIDTEIMFVAQSQAINAQLARMMENLMADSRTASGGADEQPVSWGKEFVIYLLSPFVSLVRFLV